MNINDQFVLDIFQDYLPNIIGIYQNGSQCFKKYPHDYDYAVLLADECFLYKNFNNLLKCKRLCTTHNIDIQYWIPPIFNNLLHMTYGYITSFAVLIWGEPMLPKWNFNIYYNKMREYIEKLAKCTCYQDSKRSTVIKDWKHLYTAMCLIKNNFQTLSQEDCETLDILRNIGINYKYATQILDFFNVSTELHLGIFDDREKNDI